MVDFHTHILPHMDDGSHSREESVRMLKALRTQGVDTAALTPHYYARRESPAAFLERRTDSFKRLEPCLTAEHPQVLLGAEVQYYNGISQMELLPKLRLSGTAILLLEMPFAPWSSFVVDEVREINSDKDTVVMLAHIERYLTWQKMSTWDRLLAEDIIMQSNAEFYFTPLIRRKAVQMFAQGRTHVLGTDCHNLTTRAPHMDLAFETLKKQLGTEAEEEVKRRSDAILKELSL